MVLGQEQAQRYARHFVLKEIGVSGQKKLLQSSVLVIGAGALGSAAIISLAAAGVGTIGIADYDEVEISNLQRQVIHKTERTGMKKTASAELTIRELNPDINVRLHDEKVTTDNITDIISMYDFVIDGTDRFETKFLINDACVLAEIPYSHAGVVRFEGQAMTYVPKKGPCLRCLLGSVPPPQETLTCSQAGVLGAVTGIVGSVQALEAIKYLLGTGNLLTGRVFTIDGLDMVSKVTTIPHSDPDCAVCGTKPSILSLKDNKEEYEIKSCTI